MLRNLKASDTNLIVAMAALITSVVAVVIAWDESRVLRQAYRTAFTPVLEVRSGFVFREGEQETNARGQVTARRGEISTFAVTVRNVGPGVANIESGRVLYTDKAIAGYKPFMEAMFGPKLAAEATLDAAPTLGFLPADGQRQVIGAEWDTRYPHLANFVGAWLAEEQETAREAFDYVVCYCSLFGECWNAHANRSVPEPVKSCEAGDDPSLALQQAYQRGE